MRATGFRGKRVDNDKWIYGYLWVSYANDYYIITSGWMSDCANEKNLTCNPGLRDEKDMHWVKRVTVGQSTGLTDKNGKDIYEGDYFIDKEESIIGYVTFESGCFGLEWHEVFEDFCIGEEIVDYEYFGENYLDQMEIAGNIHDSPELSEGEKHE